MTEDAEPIDYNKLAARLPSIVGGGKWEFFQSQSNVANVITNRQPFFGCKVDDVKNPQAVIDKLETADITCTAITRRRLKFLVIPASEAPKIRKALEVNIAEFYELPSGEILPFVGTAPAARSNADDAVPEFFAPDAIIAPTGGEDLSDPTNQRRKALLETLGRASATDANGTGAQTPQPSVPTR